MWLLHTEEKVSSFRFRCFTGHGFKRAAVDVSHPEMVLSGLCVCVWGGDSEMQVFVGGELSRVLLFQKGKAKAQKAEGYLGRSGYTIVNSNA